MIETGFLVIVGIFIIYYILILIFEKRLLRDPKDIIEKMLAIILLYAGISIVFFSLTGKHFLSNTEASYSVYLFIIGFIAVIWNIPIILQEFSFFRRFMGIEREMWEKEKRELMYIKGIVPKKFKKQK